MSTDQILCSIKLKQNIQIVITFNINLCWVLQTVFIQIITPLDQLMQILLTLRAKFILTHTMKWYDKSSLQNNWHTLSSSLDWQPMDNNISIQVFSFKALQVFFHSVHEKRWSISCSNHPSLDGIRATSPTTILQHKPLPNLHRHKTFRKILLKMN